MGACFGRGNAKHNEVEEDAVLQYPVVLLGHYNITAIYNIVYSL